MPIDMQTNQGHPISHYEYTIARNYLAERNLKQLVFARMKELDGWCPEDKASFMMDLVFNHRPEVIVEIGVWGGKSLIPMAEALKYNKRGIVYGIDPWKSEDSVVGQEGVNYDWWKAVDHVHVMEKFIARLNKYQLNDYVKVIRTTSEDAEPIDRIDLIHIDGNHSEETSILDVQKWVPLVRNGGFIIFDDLNWATTAEAVRWLDLHCHRVTTFHGDNVWGVWLKVTD